MTNADVEGVRQGGTAERITVNLTAKSAEALAEAAQRNRDSKTDSVNKALLVYALLLRTQNGGGSVYLRENPNGELERLRIL